MTNLHRIFAFICIALNPLFGVGTAKAQLPPVGSQVIGNLSLKTDYTPYNLSLPQGPWLVAFTQTKSGEMLWPRTGNYEFNAFGDIALVQISQKKITGLILVKIKLKTSGSDLRNPPICNDRTNA